MSRSGYSDAPLPKIKVSTADKQHWSRIITHALNHAMWELERNDGHVDKHVWKCTRKKERFAIYKSTAKQPSDLDAVIEDPAMWHNASMMIIGSVEGSLEDVLLGIAHPDEAFPSVRRPQDEVSSGRRGSVVKILQSPSKKDPFSYRCIKWVILPSGSRLQQPRDFVYIEAVGCVTRSNGQPVGYCIRHSIQLSALRELHDQNVTRGWGAATTLFTPSSNANEVDVRTLGHFSAGRGHKMADKLSMRFASQLLLQFVDADYSALQKKLAWLCVQHRASTRVEAASTRSLNNYAAPVVPTVKMTSSAYGCGVCGKKFGTFSAVLSCYVCMRLTCSRCHIEMALEVARTSRGHGSEGGSDDSFSMQRIATVFCKTCVATANRADAFQVASSSVHSHMSEQQVKEEPKIEQPQAHRSRSAAVVSRGKGSDEGTSLPIPEVDASKTNISDRMIARLREQQSMVSIDSSDDEVERSPRVRQESNLARRHRDQGKPMPTVAYQQQLWEQMASLRFTAESTYQIARQNSAMMFGSQSTERPVELD